MVSISFPILFLQIVNFLVLLFVLNLVLYKPIRNILKQRKDKFEGLEESVSATGRQAEEQNKAFIDGIREARAKGQKEKEALVQAATDEENEIVAKINAKAKDEMAKVKAKIVKDTDAVRGALEKEIDTFADTITQKILGRAA
jgi:F-type H+-transporting ATPase subunit b